MIGQARVGQRTRCLAAFFACAALSGPTAHGEDSPGWLPGHGLPGVDGFVRALAMWDPDGSGPVPSRLVVGGDFTVAGQAIVNNIAMWDGNTWSPLGTGMNGSVNALVTLPNGDLIAGGDFSTAGGVVCVWIARWDGKSWSPLGTRNHSVDLSVELPEMPGVSALAALPNGDLIAGGRFGVLDILRCSNIARWNGETWSALGEGVSGRVCALAVLPTGCLVVAGDFTSAGNVQCSRVAHWDGKSWSALGKGMNGGDDCVVSTLATLPSGDLIAAGTFTMAGSVRCDNVARWDGKSWSPIGPGLGSRLTQHSDNCTFTIRDSGKRAVVRSLVVLRNGDLIAGGAFTKTGDLSCYYLARWNGESWSTLMSDWLYRPVESILTLPTGDLVIGGFFKDIAGVPCLNIARYDGRSWHSFGLGTNDTIVALRVLSNGDLVAGGDFTTLGGALCSYVARFDGNSWLPVGKGMDFVVNAFATLANGDLIAGGSFKSAGGVPCSYVARWDGRAWYAMSSGIGDKAIWPTVYALVTLPNGDLVAGGVFTSAGGVPCNNVARWNGKTWSALGEGVNGQVRALAVLPAGGLAVAGHFTSAGGVSCNGIACWDGRNWSSLGTGVSLDQTAGVRALTVLPNGDLVAGGDFTTAGGAQCNGIARWNGAAWSPLGEGIGGETRLSACVYALVTLQNGDIIAGGTFTRFGGVQCNGIARWDGKFWSSLGKGVGYSGDMVLALAVLPNGELVVGGSFVTAGGRVSAFLARWSESVPNR